MFTPLEITPALARPKGLWGGLFLNGVYEVSEKEKFISQKISACIGGRRKKMAKGMGGVIGGFIGGLMVMLLIPQSVYDLLAIIGGIIVGGVIGIAMEILVERKKTVKHISP
jgi:outer membrane lipoprotein SlyB